MRNDRLRSAIAESGHSLETLASEMAVDPKTVSRWISGRVPHARSRIRMAQLLGRDEHYLWPGAMPEAAAGGGSAEVVTIWPTRNSVPAEVWAQVLTAEEHLDMLVYAGGLAVEAYGLIPRLTHLSAAGGQGRLLLGDPDSEAVIRRGVDEGLPSLPHRARSTVEYLSAVLPLPGVELRVHDVPLYVSIYRGDSDMLVNLHTHGLPALQNPMLHLRQVEGEPLFDYYAAAFDRVWRLGRPVASREVPHGQTD